MTLPDIVCDKEGDVIEQQNDKVADTAGYSWLCKFKESHSPYVGYVDSLEDALDVLREYELKTTTQFRSHKVDKTFGNRDPFTKSRKVYFSDENIPFDGVPFTIIGTKAYDCQHGPDRKKAFKQRKKDENNKVSDHSFAKKTKFLTQNTIKFDCPARVRLSEVIKYPDYKIRDNTARLKRDTSEKLRSDIQNGKKTKFERRIYIYLAKEDEHKDHVIGEVGGILQSIDKRLVQHIENLVGEGVKTVGEMKRHLKQYVKTDLFPGQTPPPLINRRYYPTDVDIRNHMYQSSVKQMFSKIDQENLEKKVENWQKEHPQDSIYFRPCALSKNPYNGDKTKEVCDEDFVEAYVADNLLFAHQTAWQKRLMVLYGNEITLLDATYKTMRYELPLFFLVVKTNVNYIVVGSFVIQNETTASIREALGIFSGWNVNWKPRYFMTDFCHEEINAIESVFTDTTTYICDFHREQCWERWLRKGEHGLTQQRQTVLAMLRNIAKAATEEKSKEAVSLLKSSTLWLENPKLQNWFGKTWMPEIKRWAWTYRQDRFMVNINTNNGIERQNESLKYQYLKDRKANSLSGMITILLQEFLPDKYRRYVELNTQCSQGYRRYNKDIPAYLHNRPRQFLDHCRKRIYNAEEIQPQDITETSNGQFKVKSSGSKQCYALSFGTEDDMPKCSCQDFKINGLLCKHFFAIFQNCPNWQWDALPKIYRQNPHLSLDTFVIANPKEEHVIEYEESDYIKPERPTSDRRHAKGVPTTEHNIKKEGTNCREVLKRLISLTYNIESLDTLKNLHADLKKTFSEFVKYQSYDKEDAHSNKVKATTSQSTESRTNNYMKLPIRPKKNRFNKRSGEFASMMQAHYDVHVPVQDTDSHVKSRKRKVDDEPSTTPAHKVKCSKQPATSTAPTDVNEVNSSKAGQNNNRQSHSIPITPENRVKLARTVGIRLEDAMLDVNTISVKQLDLWTLLPPDLITNSELMSIATQNPSNNFTAGYLADNIIDSYFKNLEKKHPHIIGTDTCINQVIIHGGSTKRTWSDKDLTKTKIVLFPLNLCGAHWTLLAFDKISEEVKYFDPLVNAINETVVTKSNQPTLMKHIDKFRNLVKEKLEWETSQWSFKEPKHVTQADRYNCGIFVCHFGKCLAEQLDPSHQFRPRDFRMNMLSLFFGYCYDDIGIQWNLDECKKCRNKQSTDQLMCCNKCGQYYHTQCLNTYVNKEFVCL